MKIQKMMPIKNQPTNPDENIRQASKMYEEYFLNEMMKSMRKTIDHSKMNTPSMAQRIYTEQLDSQYVQNWADRGGVGLAEIIYNQLQDRFFNQGQFNQKPSGPIQIQKGTTIKIDESAPRGIPVVGPATTLPSQEMSFLYQWSPDEGRAQSLDVFSPYDGHILQSFRSHDDRQMLKIAHDNGLQSTISFLGQVEKAGIGDSVSAGQKVGRVSPFASGLTWQVGQIGS